MFAPRLVPQADRPPFRCVFTGLIDGPFVDCGPIASVPMQETSAFLHPTAIHQIASAIGMASKVEHEKALSERDLARARVEELETELDRAQQETDAIAGLTKGDWHIRKPVGRKKAKEVA